MKRVSVLLTSLILLLVLIAGCAQSQVASRDEAVESGMAMATAAPAPMAGVASEEGKGYAADMAVDGQVPADANLASTQERMIIRTVTMSVIVEDTDATLAAVRTLLGDYEGYVADSNRYLQDDQPYATVTIRVPADKLDAALDRLRGLAISVVSESSSGEDVTEEYYDLEARIANLKAAEEELREMLSEVRENNGKAEDVLAIYRELTDIRGQIDSLEGRQQYLSRLSALSTVTLYISPKAAPAQIVEPESWNPLVTASRALRGFVSFLQFVVSVLIYVLIFSPFILVPIAIIWLIVRGARRRRARRAAEAPAAPAQDKQE